MLAEGGQEDKNGCWQESGQTGKNEGNSLWRIECHEIAGENQKSSNRRKHWEAIRKKSSGKQKKE